MSISKGFRYKDEKGKVTDYEYGVNGSNVTQDANHRLVTDEEKKKWNGKADPEDIPSGSAASYSVANNDTTTQAGFVADARIVKQHGDEIDQLSSEINSIGKLLWSGSFTSGSITVPGLSNYSYVIVNVGGIPCFGAPEYGGNVIGGYASYAFGYRSYRFSVNGDKLTIDDINKGGSDGTGNVEVRNIIGLIPKISA